MLTQLKSILGITDTSKDVLLQLLIDRCTNFVKDYCHITSTTGLEDIIVEMSVINYNRLKTEGLNSESYSGVSFNYNNEYPPHIYSRLQSNRKLRLV